MSTATIAPTGTWNVDAKHSKVGFAVKHLGIATVRGEFTEFEGVLEIGEDLASTRAYGTVKTESVDTSEAARDEHLRAADFFNAETNPDITFESTSIEQFDDDVLKVTGNLTINGVTKEEAFHAEIQGTEVDPWGNDRVGLEVSGQISRGAYGMKFNQVLGSGNLAVADKVKIVIDISAVKAA
ncbi:MAG: YceI family protein [Actinomycetota bacterium]|nr:YceI family protein [Actinomycetota bacterium]